VARGRLVRELQHERQAFESIDRRAAAEPDQVVDHVHRVVVLDVGEHVVRGPQLGKPGSRDAFVELAGSPEAEGGVGLVGVVDFQKQVKALAEVLVGQLEQLGLLVFVDDVNGPVVVQCAKIAQNAATERL